MSLQFADYTSYIYDSTALRAHGSLLDSPAFLAYILCGNSQSADFTAMFCMATAVGFRGTSGVSCHSALERKPHLKLCLPQFYAHVTHRLESRSETLEHRLLRTRKMAAGGAGGAGDGAKSELVTSLVPVETRPAGGGKVCV